MFYKSFGGKSSLNDEFQFVKGLYLLEISIDRDNLGIFFLRLSVDRGLIDTIIGCNRRVFRGVIF